ncbi:MAG: YceI family protein [Bacteroidia bacterium]|nr:YceI family protein [Bacteroidia bacterium]
MKALHKLFTVSLLFFLTGTAVSAQSVYLATGGNVNFFSETPLENIDASSQSMTAVLTSSTGEVMFTVPMRTFKFKKSLMEEHFNEKYVESEKYPKATFKGKINEGINWQRDTVAGVTASGTFTLHGVARDITEKGTLKVEDGKIYLSVNFLVALKDYNIEVPKVVTQSIAEVIKVSLHCTFVPYVKKT